MDANTRRAPRGTEFDVQHYKYIRNLAPWRRSLAPIQYCSLVRSSAASLSPRKMFTWYVYSVTGDISPI